MNHVAEYEKTKKLMDFFGYDIVDRGLPEIIITQESNFQAYYDNIMHKIFLSMKAISSNKTVIIHELCHSLQAENILKTNNYYSETGEIIPSLWMKAECEIQARNVEELYLYWDKVWFNQLLEFVGKLDILIWAKWFDKKNLKEGKPIHLPRLKRMAMNKLLSSYL